MKRALNFLIVLTTLIFAGVLYAAAEIAAPGAVQPAAAPSVVVWFAENKAAVFGVLLAVSELLSLIPAFKGNGLLDTFIKALQALSGKEQQQ